MSQGDRTRLVAAAALAVTIALGLGSRRIHLGVPVWDKSLGDALYAVMIYELALLARPTARPIVLVSVAFGVSFAIELFQLTGIPEACPRVVQLVLGTTFAWHDVACYAVGAAVVGAIDRVWRVKLGDDSRIG